MNFDFFSPLDYVFHRPMLERASHYQMTKDGKLYLLINALGVAPEDISVDVQPNEYNKNTQILKVSGSTHNDVFDRDFSVVVSFNIYKPIKEINKLSENGYLTLELVFEEPVKPNIKIGQLDRKALTD